MRLDELISTSTVLDKQSLSNDQFIYHYTSFRGAIQILKSGRLLTRGFGISFTLNQLLNYQSCVGLGGTHVALQFDRREIESETALIPYSYSDPFLDVGDEQELRSQEHSISIRGLCSIRIYETYADSLPEMLRPFQHYVEVLESLTSVPVAIVEPPIFD